MKAARLIERGGASAPERLLESAERRRLLKLFGGAALVASASPLMLAGCASRRGDDPSHGERVVVLGAGLAGLTACHLLAKSGVHAVVYEAASTAGGRTRSIAMPNVAAPVELGGEFIDSAHTEMLALVRELGLELFDGAPDGALEFDRVYVVDGQRVSELELVSDFVPLARAILEAREAMIGDGEDISYLNPSNAERYDQMSLGAFIAASGAGQRARKILETAYVNEYGLDVDRQSALNLIMMFSDDNLAESAGAAAWAVYGDSDERYRVRDGNQRVAETLAARYRDRIHYAMPLAAIRDVRGGRIEVAFANGKAVRADRVICTVPFSILRTLDLAGLDLSPLKRRAIAELGYGTNAKLCVPLAARPWLEFGEDGSVYSDADYQSMWDPHVRRDERHGVLTNYLGGSIGLGANRDPDVEARARRLLAQLEPLWPGIQALQTPGAVSAHWPSEPWVRASYSGYLIGQWTGIGGVEAEPHGRLSFAGEHTSSSYQGYMAGAVESAIRAVDEVLGKDSARLTRAARRSTC